MKKEGKIYILRNSYLKNAIVKIGRTSRISEKRAKEISSSTGVPFEYEVLYEEDVLDSHLAEKLIHKKLNDRRINKNREFFDIPLKTAVKAVFETCLYINRNLLNTASSRLFVVVDENGMSNKAPYYLSEILPKYKGLNTKVFVYYESDNARAILGLSENWNVELSAGLINDLKKLKSIKDVLWATNDQKYLPEFHESSDIPF